MHYKESVMDKGEADSIVYALYSTKPDPTTVEEKELAVPRGVVAGWLGPSLPSLADN